jgi:hypothetical protein
MQSKTKTLRVAQTEATKAFCSSAWSRSSVEGRRSSEAGVESDDAATFFSSSTRPGVS